MSATSIEEHLDYLKKQEAAFFRTDDPRGVAVLSAPGAVRNEERANHAYLRDTERHHYRIEDTPAGRYIDTQKLSREEKRELKDAAHVRMAEAARGRIEVYAIDAPQAGVFRQEVLPAILANRDVSHVNDTPVSAIARPTPGEQFNTMQASELARDKSLGLLRDPAHPGSLYHGDLSQTPQPRPAGPREADPHETPHEVLKEFHRLQVEDIQRRKEERRRDRDGRPRDFGRDGM